MNEKKNKAWLKWLIIILGVVALVIAAFFIVQAVMHNTKYSTKEYNIEESADGVTVKLNTVERLPMEDEKCLERIVLIGKEETFDCLIANMTITNNTDDEYDYSYRNFGHRDALNGDKVMPTSITRVGYEGIDVTKDMASGESHTQDVLYSIQNTENLNDIQIIYKVNPRADDGGAEISLPL